MHSFLPANFFQLIDFFYYNRTPLFLQQTPYPSGFRKGHIDRKRYLHLRFLLINGSWDFSICIVYAANPFPTVRVHDCMVLVSVHNSCQPAVGIITVRLCCLSFFPASGSVNLRFQSMDAITVSKFISSCSSFDVNISVCKILVLLQYRSRFIGF